MGTGKLYNIGFVSSQKISGGTIIVNSLTIDANVISGLANPTYPSAATNKNYVDTISGNLAGGLTDTPSTWSDMTMGTGLTAITVGVSGSAGTTVNILGYSAISSNAISGQSAQYWLLQSGSSYDHTNFVASSTAIGRFSDSSNMNWTKITAISSGFDGRLDTLEGASYIDTSGTPVDDDFAKFTDVNTIEGRSYPETRSDLGIQELLDSGTKYTKAYQSGQLIHDAVTLSGTPDYISIANQVITRGKLDLNDDTNFIEGTGIDLSTNTVSVLGYQTISGNAYDGQSHSGNALLHFIPKDQDGLRVTRSTDTYEIAFSGQGNTTVYSGQNKFYISTNVGSIPQSLPQLSDVDSNMSPSDGEVLTYDGTENKWSSQTSAGGVSALSGMNDTDFHPDVLTDDHVLKWDTMIGKWSGSTLYIASLGDVDYFGPSQSDGDVLTWNATDSIWSSQSSAGGITGWYNLNLNSEFQSFGGNVSVSGTQDETLALNFGQGDSDVASGSHVHLNIPQSWLKSGAYWSDKQEAFASAQLVFTSPLTNTEPAIWVIGDSSPTINIDGYMASDNAVTRFADSSNINTKINAKEDSLDGSEYYPSSLGKGVSGAVLANTLHSANSAIHTFNVANYIVSTTAIGRFADSSQYSTDKASWQAAYDHSGNTSLHLTDLVSGALIGTAPITLSASPYVVGATTTISIDGYVAVSANAKVGSDLSTSSGNTYSQWFGSGAQLGTAYDHSQDNTQAHSDYLLNNADDTTNGLLTSTGDGFRTTTGSLSGANISGSWTAPIYRTNKPLPSVSHEGQIIVASGGAGKKSWVYICLHNDANSYEWIQLGIST